MIVVGVLVGERLARAPLVDLLPPVAERLLVGLRLGRRATAAIMSSSTCAQSPTIGTSTLTFLLIDDGSMSTWILRRARRERVEPAGDAVVEARADADHHVAIVHRHVGFVGAVHAEHAEPLRIGGREGAEPHQRRGDREAGQLRPVRAAARSRCGPELMTPPPV